MNLHKYKLKKLPVLFVWITGYIICLCSCRKLVETDPPINSIVESNVFTIDGQAIAVLTGIYSDMSKVGPFTGSNNISVLTGLSADELTMYSGISNTIHPGYYRNDLRAASASGMVSVGSEFWQPLFNYVYKCNAAIEGLNAENAKKTLTPAIRQQLIGEAFFMRAFFYFYLTNMFGDLPLAITTDYQINTLLPRASVRDVYKQIISDLKIAQELLSDNYLAANLRSNTTERVRPTKWAAHALLARVYLYTDDNERAEIEATKVISNISLFTLPSLNDVFLKNSQEAIWQLQPTNLYFNTEDGKTFIIPPTGPSNSSDGVPANPVYLSPQVLAAFETSDQRISNWVDSTIVTGSVYPYANKYKMGTLDSSIKSTTQMTEYLMVLRLGEQYLIRAEARAHQNNIGGAQEDLNAIRTRAGLSSTAASDKAALLTAIVHERQVELFTEWGHRWFDLKRTGMVNVVMREVTPLKGGSWEITDVLYPILYDDILKSPNVNQNAGY